MSGSASMRITSAASARSCSARVPPPVARSRFTILFGVLLAGLGVAAVGFGGYQYTHAKSLISDANASYAANGGYYTTPDLDKINSAKRANSNSKVVGAVGAGLVVLGAVLVFAF